MTGEMMRLVPALFGFSGRMRRRDFWFYTVFSNFGLFILTLIDVIVPQLVLPGGQEEPVAIEGLPAATGIAILFLVTMALAAWMAAAMLGKRLHDRGKSLVWLLALLVPVVGWGWLFVECGLLEGSISGNKYGPSPKPAPGA